MKSIRSFLLMSLLLLIVSQACINIYKLFSDSNVNISEFYDKQLMQIAYAMPRDVLPQSDSMNGCDNAEKKRIVIMIWNEHSQQPIYRSCPWLELVRPTATGFTDEVVDDITWRVFVLQKNDRIIAVAQSPRGSEKVLFHLTSKLIGQIVFSIPLFILILWYVVNRSLRPLKQFANELEARSPAALQSVALDNLPRELIPVADALNDLLNRLRHAIAAQENFIEDAAHEILTPLTALQVQVQVLERAKTEERRVQAIHDVRESLERCVNLARQLLTLARSTEPSQTEFTEFDLVAVARLAVEESLPKAQSRQIDLGVIADNSVNIVGDKLALQVLMRNLIDNAIKYSPVGGQVDVIIGDGENPTLTVSDSGPGVAPEEQGRIFDRFYRGENPDIEGTGLGLAIVKQIAERHRAEITLKSPGSLGGLDVSVQFYPGQLS
jgi:two-component system, OmpR family, sensor kinase